jgi:uncharacterized phosphosugar-binding protein
VHEITTEFSAEVRDRLQQLDATAKAGGFDAAVEILVASVAAGGVIQAFGTGHSEAFAMELAGRAGGFVPSHALRLNDLVVMGVFDKASLSTPEFERHPRVVESLFTLYDIQPADCFVIASNSGANGSTVGLALRAQEAGHKVIAVTSLDHSSRIESRHPSGKRLFEIADVVIDNLAPYGDSTLQLGDGPRVGPVSSITAAYIGQLLTLATAARLAEDGITPPIFLSANIPGGDQHNTALQALYGRRLNVFSEPDDGVSDSPGDLASPITTT